MCDIPKACKPPIITSNQRFGTFYVDGPARTDPLKLMKLHESTTWGAAPSTGLPLEDELENLKGSVTWDAGGVLLLRERGIQEQVQPKFQP